MYGSRVDLTFDTDRKESETAETSAIMRHIESLRTGSMPSDQPAWLQMYVYRVCMYVCICMYVSILGFLPCLCNSGTSLENSQMDNWWPCWCTATRCSCRTATRSPASSKKMLPGGKSALALCVFFFLVKALISYHMYAH